VSNIAKLTFSFLLWAVLQAPAAAADSADNSAAHQAETRNLAKTLALRLGGELKVAMQNQGAGAAIAVCKDRAPALAAELSRESGARVSRVSLQPRDPLLGMPDAWEQQALAEFEARAAKGEAVDAMERAEIVAEPQGRFFRYLKPLPTQELCLSCHGPRESLSDAVKDALAHAYPHDRATGYSVGRIRGAISVKRPL
jgi:hypothetical protein